jgi:hypothetical protein
VLLKRGAHPGAEARIRRIAITVIRCTRFFYVSSFYDLFIRRRLKSRA